MPTIGIVGNGPTSNLPDFAKYKNEVDVWIGADGGALTLLHENIEITYAIGDFDSVNEEEKKLLRKTSISFIEYPSEKDESDIELALLKAYELNAKKIYLFGVTGGRLDHELVNIQLLYSITKKNIRGIVVDKYNKVELTMPDLYKVSKDEQYPYISFIPYTKHVKGLTLTDFYYPLVDKDISWGSTLCISNKLTTNNGTFFYKEGILLLIKSREF